MLHPLRAATYSPQAIDLGASAVNDLIHNERTKLTATWINGVSLALFAGGGFGPWVAYVNASGSQHNPLVLSTISTVCILVAVSLHWFARLTLGRMRQ